MCETCDEYRMRTATLSDTPDDAEHVDIAVRSDGNFMLAMSEEYQDKMRFDDGKLRVMIPLDIILEMAVGGIEARRLSMIETLFGTTTEVTPEDLDKLQEMLDRE